MSSHRSRLADPRFDILHTRLQTLEENFGPIPEEDGVRVHAAVSLILREGAELEVLLIKRAEIDGDPWSGQMAFPGGRKDASDFSLLQTAMRETEEEVGLSLESEAVRLGRLAPTIPATHRLPPITIFPFVFGVPSKTQARVASSEVDETLWVPLSRLQSPGSESTVEIHYPDGSSRDFPCLRINGRVVWGLTYRILVGFFGILPSAQTYG